MADTHPRAIVDAIGSRQLVLRYTIYNYTLSLASGTELSPYPVTPFLRMTISKLPL